VWEGRFGAMLIEVRDGVAYVNGQRVDPCPAPATPRGQAPATVRADRREP